MAKPTTAIAGSSARSERSCETGHNCLEEKKSRYNFAALEKDGYVMVGCQAR